MKMLLAAVAMMIASPAFAQNMPAGNQADHAAHAAPSGQAGHSGHTAAPAADPHAGHNMPGGVMDCCKTGADGAMACCAKMKTEGKAMACCDKVKADGKVAPAGARTDPHAGRNMSPQ